MQEPSIEDLILAGAVEVSGIDSETGEFLYQFTNKLQIVMPELYKAHLQNVHYEIMYFFEKGFLDIDQIESDNPIIRLTSKSFNDEELSELSTEARSSLEEIKRILKVV